MGRARVGRSEILAEAESAMAEFVGPEGRVSFDSPAHIVIGRKL